MSRSRTPARLIQTLRRHRRPVSGQALAAELGISIRTLYRDIATLQGQGAPIEGELAWAMCSSPASCCRR
ncbi:helix-turn-helix domain-containing protein [Mesorhizobium calcicola]|uniref:Helix-turn-helix domain-containing protein n=1 Tax=Mesorhizobium calcicola TaxID=1300310 RepID=A0ABW4WNC3_9HYPH